MPWVGIAPTYSGISSQRWTTQLPRQIGVKLGSMLPNTLRHRQVHYSCVSLTSVVEGSTHHSTKLVHRVGLEPTTFLSSRGVLADGGYKPLALPIELPVRLIYACERNRTSVAALSRRCSTIELHVRQIGAPTSSNVYLIVVGYVGVRSATLNLVPLERIALSPRRSKRLMLSITL